MGTLMLSNPSHKPSRDPWVVILTLTSLLISLVIGEAVADDDPLEWRPPAGNTQFRKRLSDADYQRLSSAVASGLPQAIKDAKTKLPDHGLKISGVFARGALEAQGMTLNDVVATVDGQDLWGRHSMASEEPIRVRSYSARQDRFREFKVTTDLGHAFSIQRRPDLAYLRSKNRNAAWDVDTFVGADHRNDGTGPGGDRLASRPRRGFASQPQLPGLRCPTRTGARASGGGARFLV